MPTQILVAHQPAYLAWHGYFARLLDVDRLVLLDHVQFAERGRQHRNTIRGPGGMPIRLTVPVRRRFGQPINQVGIADAAFAGRHWRTITQSYQRAAHWDRYAPFLADIYHQQWTSLLSLDVALIRFILNALELDVTLVYSSTLSPTGTRTRMLVNLCDRLGASVIRIGTGGSMHYLDPVLLADAAIRVEAAGYGHPPYRQGRGPFTPGVAALDLILHQGPAAIDVLRAGAITRPWHAQTP